MAKIIGVFAKEDQVINTINDLEQAGFVTGDLSVFAKDASHSRRIERESDVHVDELQEIAQARSGTNDAGDGNLDMTFNAAAILPGAGLNGVNGYSAGPIVAGSYLFNDGFLADDQDGIGDALQALGLDNQEIDACRQVIRQGSTVVVVDTDDSKSMLDQDGGPDLTRLGIAEAVFRQNDAASIISGS
ncbi:MAG: hypothetical protein ACE3L7_02150 [Candidatus Pristimantibacillus sp.]